MGRIKTIIRETEDERTRRESRRIRVSWRIRKCWCSEKSISVVSIAEFTRVFTAQQIL